MMKGILTKLKSQAEEILYRRGTGKPPVLHGATILDKINGKPRPPPSSQIKDGKMARFCPSRGFILDLRGGADGGLLFHFILSKIVV